MKLLLVSTGNVSNQVLLDLIEANLDMVADRIVRCHCLTSLEASLATLRDTRLSKAFAARVLSAALLLECVSLGGVAQQPCPLPLLSEPIRQSLYLSVHGGSGFSLCYDSIQLQPGQSLDLDVYKYEWESGVFSPLDPSEACIRWSVNIEAFGRVDQDGVITLVETPRSGYAFTVTALIENGPRELKVPVYAYRPNVDRIVGRWTEESRTPCGSTEPRTADRPIRELEFRADGTLYVTREPFECYRDYWGSYVVDYESRQIAISIDGGNRLPARTDPFGRFRITNDGRLLLREFSFGRLDDHDKRGCDYVFRRVPQ